MRGGGGAGGGGGGGATAFTAGLTGLAATFFAGAFFGLAVDFFGPGFLDAAARLGFAALTGRRIACGRFFALLAARAGLRVEEVRDLTARRNFAMPGG